VSLRSKFIVILAATIALYVIIDYGIQRFVVFPRFIDLERAEAEKDMTRCVDALRREIHHIDTTTHDWAAWTDSYNFIQGKNDGFIESTLNKEVFSNVNLNLIFYVNLKNVVFWGEIRVLKNLEEIELPRFPRGKWPDPSFLVGEEPRSGIVTTERGPMLVASRPITKTNAEGPRKGSLIMGRFLNKKEIDTLREQTKVAFSVWPIDSHDLPEGGNACRARLTRPGRPPGAILFSEDGKNPLTAYTTFAAIDGTPAFLLRAEIPREITAKGMEAVHYAWLSSLATALLVLTVVIFLAGRLVLSRIEALGAGVTAVGNGGTPSRRVAITGRDELSRLGLSINMMLDRLDRSRKVLARSEEVYRKAIESADGVPYQSRFTDGCFDFVGRGFDSLFGHPAEGFSLARLEEMMRVDTVIDPEAGYENLDDYLVAFRRGAIRQCRVDFRIDTSGGEKWISHVAVPVRDGKANAVTGALGIFQDITARKQAEEKVQMLAVGVEQSIDGIAVAGLDGQILVANPAWASMHGMQADELPGLHLSAFHSEEQLEKDVVPFNKKVFAQGSHEGEVGHVRRDGTVFSTWMSTTLLKNSKGAVFAMLGIARDLTVRKKLERELIQVQKMRAVGRFADGVARDYDELLSAVRRDCELILSRIGSGDIMRRDVEEIRIAGERAASLTGHLLAFSRQMEINPEALDLNEVIRDAAPKVRNLVGEKIELVLEPAANLARVRADRNHLDEALLNLASNARDAMPHGGRLILRTGNTVLGKKECASMPGLRPGRFVRIDVVDNGVGMNRAIREQIFEPFFTTKGEGAEAGLGLSTVYGIVKQHESWIDVESHPGEGSTFSIFMPVTGS
jgi:PAS domain S-box-containing protein